MYWQEREIYRQALVSDPASTVVIDLPRSNVLSGLVLNVQATNGATAGNQYPIDMVSRIEVIADGSKELFSMTGKEAFITTYALTGKIPPCNHSLAANAGQFSTILIPFGRFLGDPEYYLDCGSFTSLELRVTFNATVGETGIASGSLYLEVLGLMAMEGPPAPRKGTFKISRKYNFVTASDGDVVLDLPRANLYRKLIVMTFSPNNPIGNIFSRVSLDVNNGEKVIYAGRVKGLSYKSIVELGLDTIPTESTSSNTLATSFVPATLGDLLVIPFDIGNDMANCLNSAVYDKVTLTLTQASPSISASVILNEVLS